MSNPQQIVYINLEPLNKLDITVSKNDDYFEITYQNEIELAKPDSAREELMEDTKTSKPLTPSQRKKTIQRNITSITEYDKYDKIEFLNQEPAVLREFILKHFYNNDKLHALCQYLKIEYGTLSGESIIGRACDLAEQLTKKRRANDFVYIINQFHSDLKTLLDEHIDYHYKCLSNNFSDDPKRPL